MTENSNLPDAATSWTLSYVQFAAILFNGLERLAEIQKSALLVCTKAIADSADPMRPPRAAASIPSLYELAEQAIREFLQIQVRLLDLMLKQTAAVKEAVQRQSGGNFEGEIARVLYDSTDCLLNMQRQALDFITHENQAFAQEVLKQGTNGDTGNAGALQPNTSAIIQAQKRFWDVTLKPFRMMNAVE